MPERVAHIGPPDDDMRLVDRYRTAIDEYRWQVAHNWSRTQYLLVFNTGIVAAAVALSARPGRGPAALYAGGAVCAVLSMLVIATQHDYYRAARDRMRRIEARLNIPADERIDTTATLGNRHRFVSVNTVIYLLLAIIATGNIAGAVYTLVR